MSKRGGHVIYNDTSKEVVGILNHIKNKDINELLNEVDSYIKKYGLSKQNRDGFLQLRSDYNISGSKEPMMLYTLICYSFNNQIRFNKNGEYNMPFGKDRSSFNEKLRSRFGEFCEKLHNIDCTFINGSFDEFCFDYLCEDDFVYCDPPYLNSVAPYNEQNGWMEDDELRLLNVLDCLNERGIRFALSNNLKYGNRLLEKWKDKYTVHYLNASYKNCNYQKKDCDVDVEVLITNY